MYISLFFERERELEASLTIRGSPVIDKWLYNATSIFFILTTRLTIFLFGWFLVFTCGSLILVCPCCSSDDGFPLDYLSADLLRYGLTAMGLSAV